MTTRPFLIAAILLALAAPAFANPYANGDPDSDQSYVPKDKAAYAAGYIEGGGCSDAYRLPDRLPRGNTWTVGDFRIGKHNGSEDFASGEHDGKLRRDDAKWCDVQKMILRKAGLCLHGRHVISSAGRREGFGYWGHRRAECELP